MAAPNLLVYLFYILQMLIYKKRIVSQKLSLPPLKGEVEFHHVSYGIPEGSRGQQQDLKLSESYFVTFYLCDFSNFLIYNKVMKGNGNERKYIYAHRGVFHKDR